ncbi:MAG: hypothetical protein IJ048_07635 [Clostridia bacterium]|nr:hypothetical protein [Clostridia bacterium]
MFSNVGGKLKGIAEFVCWIGILASCLGGYVIYTNSYSQYSAFYAILIAVSGSLASWLGSLGLYAFGQLVENSDICKNNLINMAYGLQKMEKSIRNHAVAPNISTDVQNASMITREINESKKTDQANASWERYGRSRMVCPKCGSISKVEYLEMHQCCPECGEKYNV